MENLTLFYWRGYIHFTNAYICRAIKLGCNNGPNVGPLGFRNWASPLVRSRRFVGLVFESLSPASLSLPPSLLPLSLSLCRKSPTILRFLSDFFSFLFPVTVSSAQILRFGARSSFLSDPEFGQFLQNQLLPSTVSRSLAL